MAVVRPLRGVRYDPTRVGDLRSVIAPPYDVIGPAEQEALYARHPCNVVRLILARDADRARAAARTLGEWMERGMLVQDPEPALYLYAQTFRLPDGSRRTREGILCRLGLEEFSTGVVRPHERTLPGPKADRLALLRATGAYLSAIFGLYSRPGERLRDLLGAAAAGPPLLDIGEAFGATHLLWRIDDAGAIARVAAALAQETIVIADGHHRYETALAYRRERGGAGGSGTILAFLTNMEDEGLVILPTHRLVKGPLGVSGAGLVARLGEAFEVGAPAEAVGRPAGAIDVILPDRRLRVVPRPGVRERLAEVPPVVRALDLAVLHGAILAPLGIGPDRLAFTHDDAEAIRTVASGEASAAFLLNPPTMAEVRAVCGAGELMPEKSTYFFPKLASGLVLDLIGPPWVP